MEKSKTVTEEIREKLRHPLPDEAVTQHPTKPYLSSIKAIYVIERLNDVFGIGNWSYKQKVIERCEGGVVVVEVHLKVPEYGISLSSFGGNDNGGEGTKNFDLGDAYKGAVTDAITKICSMLEIGIDVFKGLHVHKKKTLLNDAGFKKAMLEINSGAKGVLADLQKEYEINKAHLNLLIEAGKNPTKKANSTSPEKPEKPVIVPDTDGWSKVVVWLSKRDELVFDSFAKLRENYIIDKKHEEQLAKEAAILKGGYNEPSTDEKVNNMIGKNQKATA